MIESHKLFRLKALITYISKKRSKIQQKSNAAKFFLIYLLIFLANKPYFCLKNLISLIIGLAINAKVLMTSKIADNLSG